MEKSESGILELRRYNNEMAPWSETVPYTVVKKVNGTEDLLDYLKTPNASPGDTEYIDYDWVFVPLNRHTQGLYHHM